jgi:hypothetical protein
MNHEQQYHVIQMNQHLPGPAGIVPGRASQMLIAESRRRFSDPCWAELIEDVWVLIDEWCVDSAKEAGRRIELVTVAVRVVLPPR